MKGNQFFNILKVQHFKDTIPKFEPCLKKVGDFITPENCAIKNGLRIARPKCPDDVVLWTTLPEIAVRYGVYSRFSCDVTWLLDVIIIQNYKLPFLLRFR